MSESDKLDYGAAALWIDHFIHRLGNIMAHALILVAGLHDAVLVTTYNIDADSTHSSRCWALQTLDDCPS